MMATPTKHKTTWQKIRKLFNDIHLWIGLTTGILVVAICFSGTVYVFNTEITEMSAPHLYKVEVPAGAQRMAPDDLIEKIEEAAEGKVVSATISDDPRRTYSFNVRKKDDKSRFGTTYMVNPYTGEIAGNSLDKNGAKEFMSTMFSLHRWLLLDKIEKPIFENMTNRELGSQISGWATILFTLGCLTGLILWFPQKLKAWRQGLKIKVSGNWKRLNHDLHNTLAFYALFFLLLMGITGPQWSFKWYRDGLQKTLGVYKPSEGQQQARAGVQGKGQGQQPPKAGGGQPQRQDAAGRSEKQGPQQEAAFPLTTFMQAADKQLSYRGVYTIMLPAKEKAPVSVSKTRLGFFAPAAADRLTMDAATAGITKAEIFRDKPFNERIAASIKAIHVGNVYGNFTKIIYFLACLIATSLPVTGTLIWINKLKKKRRRSSKSIISTIDKRYPTNA